MKSGPWLNRLCQNICRESGLLVEKPAWLEDRRVCLIDASDQAVYGSGQTDYQPHYGMDLFTLDVVEKCLSGAGQGNVWGILSVSGRGTW